eukprot:TRINITY_DN2527_c0_g2_i15.p1 TRINITY_DN2527_c0_g2~~TRINITY_DN2527_c0_g2_i15.p1  ORF type:complete len:288 (-),score=38.39 TRINITY_DN2527_c0_g2_i15:245-1108(-)
MNPLPYPKNKSPLDQNKDEIVDFTPKISTFKNENQQLQDYESVDAFEKIKQLHMSVARLRIFLKQHEIDTVGEGDIYCTKMSDSDRQRLQELVSDVSRYCSETIRYEGVNVTAMLWTTPESCGNLFQDGMAPWSTAEPQTWIHVVSSIALNKEQVSQLLEVRSVFLKKFGQLFSERQRLNQEVSRKMTMSRMKECSNEEEEEQEVKPLHMKRTSSDTKLQADSNVTFEQLKMNLRREQALYFLLDKKILDILTHLQLAWGILISYPEHCDCLAFVNAVYEVFENTNG